MSTIFEGDVLQSSRRNELDHPVDGARREHAVRHQLEVEVLFAEEAVHEGEELNDELVLSQIVAVLEDDRVRLSACRQELQSQREQVRLEDRRRLGIDSGNRDASVER